MNNKVIKVTCAIIENENRILVAQRSEKMSLPLKWEFPGGKIEEGESPEHCIVREIKEELGIHISIKKRLKENIHDYGDRTIQLIPFVCSIVGGEFKILEHKKIIFDEAEKLCNLDWADADVPIYREYLRYIKEK